MPDALTPDPMVPRFVPVRRVVRETDDTVTLQLADSAASAFAKQRGRSQFRRSLIC
jgi:hypothetical protein